MIFDDLMIRQPRPFEGALHKGNDRKTCNRLQSLRFRPQTGFTKENLEWLEQLFRGQLKNSQELHLEDFTKIVHSKNVSTSLRSRYI